MTTSYNFRNYFGDLLCSFLSFFSSGYVANVFVCLFGGLGFVVVFGFN